mmetsp:Transcript_47422/g.88061  ORF Transcript_47422/g.88061 Transcript_47422/m.88061 type:complete len:289 (-) Transcript_47422:444-1310(-)
MPPRAASSAVSRSVAFTLRRRNAVLVDSVSIMVCICLISIRNSVAPSHSLADFFWRFVAFGYFRSFMDEGDAILPSRGVPQLNTEDSTSLLPSSIASSQSPPPPLLLRRFSDALSDESSFPIIVEVSCSAPMRSSAVFEAVSAIFLLVRRRRRGREVRRRDARSGRPPSPSILRLFPPSIIFTSTVAVSVSVSDPAPAPFVVVDVASAPSPRPRSAPPFFFFSVVAPPFRSRRDADDEEDAEADLTSSSSAAVVVQTRALALASAVAEAAAVSSTSRTTSASSLPSSL